jgi:hypothetical protein
MPTYKLFEAKVSQPSVGVCITDKKAFTGQVMEAQIADFIGNENELIKLEAVRYIAVFASQLLVQRIIMALDANLEMRIRPFVFIMPSNVHRSMLGQGEKNGSRETLIVQSLAQNLQVEMKMKISCVSGSENHMRS